MRTFMYLLLLTICVLVISLSANAQSKPNNLPQLNVIECVIDCHQGMIHMTMENDSIEIVGGLFMLDYYDNPNWISTGVNISISTNIDTFDITFSGIGTFMHDYDSMRVQYRHYANNDTMLIGYYDVDCPTLNIREVYNDADIVSIEYFSINGQPLKDITNSGVYIQLVTYTNSRYKWNRVGRV